MKTPKLVGSVRIQDFESEIENFEGADFTLTETRNDKEAMARQYIFQARANHLANDAIVTAVLNLAEFSGNFLGVDVICEGEELALENYIVIKNCLTLG